MKSLRPVEGFQIIESYLPPFVEGFQIVKHCFTALPKVSESSNVFRLVKRKFKDPLKQTFIQGVEYFPLYVYLLAMITAGRQRSKEEGHSTLTLPHTSRFLQ